MYCIVLHCTIQYSTVQYRTVLYCNISTWSIHFYPLTGPTTLLKDKNGTWGPLTLYFGCRSSEHDDIYKHETNIAMKEGGLNNVYTAFSREPNVPKVILYFDINLSHNRVIT